MSNQRIARRHACAAFVAACVLALAPGPAAAGTCDGTVRGLSNNYNPSTGSGFLALRASKSANSTKIAELFNGDAVTIFAHEGRWYEVDDGKGNTGWVYDKYIRAVGCDW